LFAGFSFVHQGTILDCNDEDWDLSFNINTKGMFWMCKAFLPKVIEKEREKERKRK
jgi:2-keto-3-deoxy-L-fuconate dehydrogenase